MGIYDRDYVRRDGPSFLGSLAQRGQVCTWLIGITIVVFIVQMLTWPAPRVGNDLGWFTKAFDLNVKEVGNWQIWRLLSYAFLNHPGAILVILFDLLFLWWFGRDLEEMYGPREFLAFYLGACLAGGVLYFLSSLPPSEGAYHFLGASGGIMAVLTLCAIHFPRRTILLFFFIPTPLWLLVVGYLAFDAYIVVGNLGPTRFSLESIKPVAVPLAGALFAGAYYRLSFRLTDWLPEFWSRGYWQGQLKSWRQRLFGPRLRLYVDEKAPETPPRTQVSRGRRPSSSAADPSYRTEERSPQSVAAPAADEHLEAKMDAILEKISRVGKENLTESEREFLLRASEIFRRRRT